MKILQYPWLEPPWHRWRAMQRRQPHALLIHGPAGIGKRSLAEHIAQGLLCERSAEEGHPCGACNACRWFDDGNHPDFRLLVPEALQTTVESEIEGVDRETGAKSGKAPSREIRIDQIRAMDAFFNVGTHRGGHRVVLLYPADALNAASANALLKTLEEPPAGCVFLVVTSCIDEVLPTIRSRCAKLFVGRPEGAAAAAWLADHGVVDPEAALADAGGAPLPALDAVVDPARPFRSSLIEALASGRPIDPIALAEKCEKGGAANIALWLARWVADLLLCGSGNELRYHPRQGDAIRRVSAHADVHALHAFYRRLTRARRVAEHPLNGRLFAEDLLIEYARLSRAH